MKTIIPVVLVTFAVIGAAGALLALLYAPTTSPARLLAYIGTMFAVTGATVVAATVGALRPR